MAEELEAKIAENAAGPKMVRGDEGAVEQHSLMDQIEADRYLAAKKAAKKGLGVRLVRLVPPGAVS
jgi:hypothetical protein